MNFTAFCIAVIFNVQGNRKNLTAFHVAQNSHCGKVFGHHKSCGHIFSNGIFGLYLTRK